MYDKFAIRNLGLRAKTNFDYNRKDLIKIIYTDEATFESKQTLTHVSEWDWGMINYISL